MFVAQGAGFGEDVGIVTVAVPVFDRAGDAAGRQDGF